MNQNRIAKPLVLLGLLSMFVFQLLLTGCKKETVSVNVEYINTGIALPINDIAFFDDQNGIACGGDRWRRGLIWKTSDAGNNWRVDSISQNWVAHLATFGNKVWAVSLLSQLNISTDRGASWASFTNSNNANYNSVALYNDTTSCIVGGASYRYGFAHLYNYNGTPWYSTPIQDHELTDLAYLGPNTIVAVGYGIIEKSNDKGQTWQPSAISGDFFRAVHFPTATTGYVVGYNGMIVKTTDGGDSWQIINSGGGGLIGKSYRMRDVFFVNASKGYIVGEGGVFWRTTDGGGNWYQVAGIPDNLNMQAITVYNGKGYITTSDGRILKFID